MRCLYNIYIYNIMSIDILYIYFFAYSIIYIYRIGKLHLKKSLGRLLFIYIYIPKIIISYILYIEPRHMVEEDVRKGVEGQL